MDVSVKLTLLLLTMYWIGSAFSLLFEDDNMKVWEAFITLDEVEQDEYLEGIYLPCQGKKKRSKKKPEETVVVEAASRSFNRIDKRIRKLFSKKVGAEFIRTMDRDIYEYVTLSETDAKVYNLPDAFQRMLW